MTTAYTVGRMADAQILVLMDNLLELFPSGSGVVQVGDTNFTVTKSEEGELDPGLRTSFESLLSSGTYLITSMDWTAGTSKLSFQRGKRWGTNSSGGSVWLDNPTPFVDGLRTSCRPENAIALLEVMAKFVAMAPPISAGPEAGTALDQSQLILNRVSAAVSTLVEHTAERQKDLDKTRNVLAREAQAAIKEAEASADILVEEARQLYLRKESSLKSREEELDDRANTHVRREFAKQMASLSDTRLSSNLLTKSTLSLWTSIVLALIPVILLAIFIIIELNQVTSFSNSIISTINNSMIDENNKIVLIDNINKQIIYSQIRIVIQSLGIAALVWFALRLASTRYNLVSSWERELHKFRLDTERAGFLVEGDLEARKVNDQGLPHVLLESFSRNLFTSLDRHQSDGSSEGLGGALNALLGQAAKVRLGPDGVNVEVEGRGIRRARREIENGNLDG